MEMVWSGNHCHFCQPYRLGAVIEGLISHYLSLLGQFFIWLQDHQTPSHIIKWYRFLSQIQPVSEDSEGAMCWCPKNPGFLHHCPVHSFASWPLWPPQDLMNSAKVQELIKILEGQKFALFARAKWQKHIWNHMDNICDAGQDIEFCFTCAFFF